MVKIKALLNFVSFKRFETANTTLKMCCFLVKNCHVKVIQCLKQFGKRTNKNESSLERKWNKTITLPQFRFCIWSIHNHCFKWSKRFYHTRGHPCTFSCASPVTANALTPPAHNHQDQDKFKTNIQQPNKNSNRTK